MTLREQKQAIRAFLRTEVWSDEKLCALLAHAEDKLSMWSCCCLIGAATAKHALRGRISVLDLHYIDALKLPLSLEAEEAFSGLGGNGTRFAPLDPLGADELRRRRIRPIIRAELRRRERTRLAREHALLVLASGGRMKRAEVADIDALRDFMSEDESGTLACLILRGATVASREDAP